MAPPVKIQIGIKPSVPTAKAMTDKALLDDAVRLQQQGRLAEAEEIYRGILQSGEKRG